jgi:hypothetical protein
MEESMQTTMPPKDEGITIEPLSEPRSPIPERAETPSPGATMEPHHDQIHISRSSVFTLVRDLMEKSRTLIRQEITLAKTEMSENISYLGRNAAGLGVGVGVVYAGVIVLLIGLGFLIAWGINLAGVQGLLAAFLGLAGIGLTTMIVGAALVVKGLSAMKTRALAPQRTLHTLQELKGPVHENPKPPPRFAAPQPSSREMQSRVEDTQDHIGQTLEELRDRLSPQRIKVRIKHQIYGHPYQAGLLAVGAGLLSGLAVRRLFRRA